MTKGNILVPVDFSDASASAVHVATKLARLDHRNISLLHIHNDKSVEKLQHDLDSLAASIKNNSLQVNTLLKKGNLFTEITETTHKEAYGMMVIGTHGYKGFREKLLGADILKLLRTIPIPVIAVQKEYRFPDKGFSKILFPVSGHEALPVKLNTAIAIASNFNAEIHLYTVQKPGNEWTIKFRENIKLAKESFEKAGVNYIRVTEDQQSFSVGYSKQIMAYAKTNGIDLISMMTIPTRENYYFADSDKEHILTNDAKIPVLCSSGKMLV
ncbi:MAG: universal stress protein [Bacteroidales bacterium]|nr:universal stress protein [Bacteroidales bacterium]MCF8404488.1 universal stress protein [Bacteroidales bacterium]